ncbi:exported protein of unknown function [Candidatus Filomicrobium marinum]|uniref:Uncharacterized protein n=1 Tax=Candidatus Filomicrobium marinum TaxID=1608628 RepID=A0A0D6JDR5_9HYPH|nr:exported protein of unknown function [Candidatus Filomicrobium marinum]CPR17545.1 exported protein of unknown function [Candidatus Filomicrobium marinum]
MRGKPSLILIWLYRVAASHASNLEEMGSTANLLSNIKVSLGRQTAAKVATKLDPSQIAFALYCG